MKKWFASAVFVAWALPALAQSTPYYGTPAAVPGTIEAEDFDNGGEAVAYHDTTSGNQLGAYRLSESVDIEASSEHGYNVGKIRLTEWLNYSVNVLSTGSYTLSARVSCLGQGGTFHIEFNGVDKTGPMAIPDTGAWQTWTTISAPVTLTAGTQIMKVVVDAVGGSTAVGNWNYFTLTATAQTTVTFVQWNIHKGREECGATHSTCPNSLDEIAAYLTNINADVVSFNEVWYKHNTYIDSLGNPEDQPLVLEQKLEDKTGQCWERLFTDENGNPDGPATVGNLGNLLLWRSSDDVACGKAPGRFHKQSIYRVALPAVSDGSRSVGGVTLIIAGRAVTFFTTHLCAPPNASPSCSPAERQTQVNALKNDIGAFAAPRVIAGDFNANPTDSEIVGSSGMTANGAYVDLWPEAVAHGTANPNDQNAPTHVAGWRPDFIFRSQDTFVSLAGMKIERQRNPQTQIDVSDHFPSAATLIIQ